MATRKTFGSVRRLPSGRFQARYRAEGTLHSAPGTYASAKAAWQALRGIETDMLRGDWVDDTRGQVTFRELAAKVAEVRKAELAPGTIRGHESLMRTYLDDAFGSMSVKDISVSLVDQWWAKSGEHPQSRRNAYFHMRAIMKKAVKWGHIDVSPCQVERAGADVTAPRPGFSIQDFRAVVAAMPLEYGALMWVTFGAHTRIGETLGLNVGDYDRTSGTLTVERQFQTHGTTRTLRATKTRQAKTIVLPEASRAVLEAHLYERGGWPDSPLFIDAHGNRYTSAHVRYRWGKAARAAGVPAMRLHDIRHTSLTAVAQAGATLRELMRRGGHASPTSSLRYQHASDERDRANATALNDLLTNK